MIDFLHTERSRLKKCTTSKQFTLSKSGKGGRTYAVSKVPVQKFEVGQQVEIEIGEAICSEKDSFNKKIGRELAQSRMNKVILEVSRIVYTKDRVDVTLTSEEIEVDISFRKDKNFSRLEHVYRDN